MPAKFSYTRGQQLPTTWPQNGNLRGKPFPPDDVEALWHMVPGDFSVEYVAATHTFVIKDLANLKPPPRGRFMSIVGLRTIPAGRSFDYQVWVDVFKSLCAEAAAATLSAQNIDQVLARK